MPSTLQDSFNKPILNAAVEKLFHEVDGSDSTVGYSRSLRDNIGGSEDEFY